MFTTQGNYLYMPVYELEETKWKDLGAFINNIIPIDKNEFIIKIMAISDFNMIPTYYWSPNLVKSNKPILKTLKSPGILNQSVP